MRTMEKDKSSAWKISAAKLKRTSHLLVLNASTGSIVSYLLSYGSSGGNRPQGKIPPGELVHIGGSRFRVYGGNHPNWISHSHDISMNIVSARNRMSKPLRFDIAKISFNESRICNEIHDSRCKKVFIDPLAPYLGSGHVLFLRDGKYALVDAYAKESHFFPQVDRKCNNRNRLSVPLRLVDLEKQKDYTILEV